MKRLLKISWVVYSITMIMGFILAGCEITGEVPELNYFLNRQWKLEKVVVNGKQETEVDLSLYRLRLNDDFTFKEISIRGVETEGAWRVDNNATILVLEYPDDSEFGFIIVELQIRTLVLRVIQSESKIGSLDILYHMVPVKS